VNLMINAAQAIHPGKPRENTVTLRLSRTNGSLVAEVQDTVSGIPEANVARLFEPLFTTKGPGAGTGLGLVICKSIVESHGGHIEVESHVGKGSTFRVVLPIERS